MMDQTPLVGNEWVVYELRGSAEVWRFTRPDYANRDVLPVTWWFGGFDTDREVKILYQHGPAYRITHGLHWKMLSLPGKIVVMHHAGTAWFETEELYTEYRTAEALYRRW